LEKPGIDLENHKAILYAFLFWWATSFWQ